MKNIFSSWFALQQWKKILIAMILGIIIGLLIGDKALYLKPIGTLFINAIRMMMVPVIFTAIVCSIFSIEEPKKMRRIGAKAFGLFALTMTIASMVGLTVATLIAPGDGISIPLTQTQQHLGQLPSIAEMLINLIPTNPILAFSSGNILQILIFSLLLGLSINLSGEAAEPVKKVFNAFYVVILRLTSMIMSFSPYGVFALMAVTAGEYGLETLLPLFKLILTGYLACALLGVIYAISLRFISKISPIHFYKNISNALIFAFTSSSSTATLPISIRCAVDNLKISPNVAGFLLPLSATLNLNGLAIYLSIAAVFAANLYGVHLELAQYATLLVTVVLTSMGAGGLPGSALIVMGAVMSSIDLPLGAIPIIAGIDRMIDMAMTVGNVTGGLFTTVSVARSEAEISAIPQNTSTDTLLPSS